MRCRVEVLHARLFGYDLQMAEKFPHLSMLMP
jgi:hypothetical protein